MSGASGHPDPAAGERAIPPDAATSDPWAVVARTLLEHGVRQVLGLPDDDMASLAAFRTAGIDFVWMSSQRTAVSAAAGQAIASRRSAVVVVGRGPGVAATVPSLLEALAAHAPVLVLASGTASARLRDRAFQDAPTLALAAPVTVWAERVETGAALPGAIAEALARAGAVPGGPVLLEIPDGLTVEGEVRRPSTRMELPELLSAFLAAERPVILVGGGARGAVPPAALHELADRAGAGVAVTASGRGAASEGASTFLGVAGLYLPEESAAVVRDATVVLAVGTRLEETAVTGLPGDTPVLQVDAAVSGIDRGRAGGHVIADAGDALRALAEALPEARTTHAAWRRRVASAIPAAVRSERYRGSPLAAVLRSLADALPEGTVVVHENGLRDIWSYLAPVFRLPDGCTAVAPSELTTLGSGVAAAAGIALGGAPLTVCICGDGAFSTLLPDLGLFARRPMPLLYVVLDDGGYGWLDSQARAAGLASDFTQGSLIEALLPSVGVSCDVLTVGDGGDPAPVLRDAVARAALGRVTLVRVPVGRADVPPLNAAS